MKSYITILAASLIILNACVAQNQSMSYDDVYYSAKDKKADEHTLVVQPKKVDPSGFTKAEASAVPNEDVKERLTDEELATAMPDSGTSEYTSPEGDTYISNNYYGDDYYDYAYSARLRRFHNNYSFNNYYSDYYTNSYWYDYNPWNWGVSIYMGYNWWYPSYHSSWYWPYSSWGYYGWYDPYPYYGWGSYWHGYSNGYWSGYYDGYWGGGYYGYWPGSHYYNSYDGNSYYYGHRGSVGSSGGISGNQRGGTFQERYENQLARERNNSVRNQDQNTALASVRTNRSGGSVNTEGGNRNVSGTTAGSLRNSVRNQSNTNARPPRGLGNQDATSTGTSLEGRRNTLQQGNLGQNNQGTQVRSSESGSNQRPPRYTYQGTRTSPGSNSNSNLRNQGKVQPYSSPSYTKPRSSQEYTAPKYRNTTAPGGNQNANKSSSGNNYQAPARQENKTYTNPSNNTRNAQPSNSNSRGTYTNPTRSNENRSTPPRNTYSAPTRSSENSSPSRNNSSYSQPSRSSEYSSPSRSSSSGSSTPSRSSSGSSSSPSRSSGSSSGSGHRR